MPIHPFFLCYKPAFLAWAFLSAMVLRMVESAAHLVDEVLPKQPMRQWVLSVPYPLRLLFAREPKILSDVLGIVSRAISSFLIKRAGETHKTACTGSVTVIQRFGSALNLNIHFHVCCRAQAM